MTDRHYKFMEAMVEHMFAFQQFIGAIEDGARVDFRPWIDAAQAAFLEAGGLEAYRRAVNMQWAHTPDWSDDHNLAERMATALYIREGGMKAQTAAAKAYISAVHQDEHIMRNKVLRRARRKADKHLLKVMRRHADMCTEVSYAQALVTIQFVYKYGETAKRMPKDLSEVARCEVLSVLGFSEEMLAVLHAAQPDSIPEGYTTVGEEARR